MASLWTWGSNRAGQLGFEPVTKGTGVFASREPQLTPRKVLSSGAACIECGNSAMALIKTDGSLWTWGENSSGTLGNGTQESTWEHQHIMDDVVQVSYTLSPSGVAYAIQSDGSLWAWGENYSAYLGFKGGNSTNTGWPVQTVPRKILDGAVRVATGGMHAMALMEDGSLWAWGYNNSGVQGRGSNLPTCYSPSKVLDNVLGASGTGETTKTGESTKTEEITTPSATGFTDVSAGVYYADAVEWAVDNGVTQGTGGGAFSPESTVTRAEAVTFLWRAAGKPAPSATTSSFTDVTDRSAYYYNAVLWAVEQGITNGAGGGRFDLTGTLAYDQIFTFLCRFAGEQASGSDWSSAAVRWANSSGLTDGLLFSAKDACPRADVVYCLWKQLADDGAQAEQEEQKQEAQQELHLTQQQKEFPALVENQALAADIMDALTSGYGKVDLTGYDVDLNDARELAEELADVLWENPYQVEKIVGTMDISGKALHLTIEYIGGSAASGASRAAMEQADLILAQVVTDDMSDYDITKALHDYLVLNCAYDYDNYLHNTIPSESYTAEGALLKGTAVCSGYARAYALLMERAGIPCEYVSGYAGGGHAWNVVQIDGEWYHVDTTWDDPVPDREGYVRYDYFLKSDSYMLANRHTRWISDRTCSSTKYDNADLPDTVEQAQQQQQAQKQEQYAAIRQILEDAIAQLPYQTEAERAGATSDELLSVRYAYVTLDESYSTLTLRDAYQAMADGLKVKYPDLTISYDSEHHGYRIYRNDLVEAAKEVQAAETAARNERKEQRVAEIEAQLQQAIRQGQESCWLEGDYTFSEVGEAYRKVNADGYTVDGYTARVDYALGGYNASKVEIHYYHPVKTEPAQEESREEADTQQTQGVQEEQRFLEQIDAAIDNGELRITLQGGSYPEYPDKPWYYAYRARITAAAAGHTTPGGLVAGKDYTLEGGIDSKTSDYIVTITYPFPEMSDDEALAYFIGMFEDAVRQGQTEVSIRVFDGTQNYSSIVSAAYNTVYTRGYEVDGLVAGVDYNIYTKSSGSGISTWTIQYYAAE